MRRREVFSPDECREAAGLACNGFHHLAGALDKSFDQGD